MAGLLPAASITKDPNTIRDLRHGIRIRVLFFSFSVRRGGLLSSGRIPELARDSYLALAAAVAGLGDLLGRHHPQSAQKLVLSPFHGDGVHRAATDAGSAADAVVLQSGIGSLIRFQLQADEQTAEASGDAFFRDECPGEAECGWVLPPRRG